MADADIKIALDNPVETIQSDFNNFIQLGKPLSRRYRIEETSLSKLEGKKIFGKSILAKKEGIGMMDHGNFIWIFRFGW